MKEPKELLSRVRERFQALSRVGTVPLIFGGLLASLLIFGIVKFVVQSFRENAHRTIENELSYVRAAVQQVTDCRGTLKSMVYWSTFPKIYVPDLSTEAESFLPLHCSKDVNHIDQKSALIIIKKDTYRLASYHPMERWNRIGMWTLRTGCVIDHSPATKKTRRCLTMHGAVLDYDGSFRKDPLTEKELSWMPLFPLPFCCVDS